MVLTEPTPVHGVSTAGTARNVPGDEPQTGRQRVLEQAAWLFQRQGYRETTLRDIAAASGMKAGSIYYHFDSKEQLLDAVLETGIERITAEFVEAARTMPPGTPARERLRRHVLAHLEALYEHGPFTTSHVTVFKSAPDAVKALGVPSRDAYEQLWADLLDRFAADGLLRPDVDLALQRILLLSAANATLDWFDRNGPRTIEDLAAALTEQFWSGIATESAVPDRSAEWDKPALPAGRDHAGGSFAAGAGPLRTQPDENPPVHHPRGTANTP